MSLTVRDALERLRGPLEFADEEALDAVLMQWEEALPILLREIETAEVVSEGDELFNIGLFHVAIVLCAEKRELRAFDAIRKRVETIQKEDFPFGFQAFRLPAAWSACCEDADQLLAVFDNEALSPRARDVAFHALMFLQREERWPDAEFDPWFSELTESRVKELPPELGASILTVAVGRMPEVSQDLEDRLIEYASQQDPVLSDRLKEMMEPDERHIYRELINDRYRPGASAMDELDFLIDVNSGERDDELIVAMMNDPVGLLTILDREKEMELVDLEGVGRNDACPCGSGKKFKKCCQGKEVTFAPVDRISCLGTPVRQNDQFVSDLIEAGYLYDENMNDELAQMACWLLALIVLRGRVPKSVSSPSAIEKKKVFVGTNPLSEWIEDFCRLVFLLFTQQKPAYLLAHSELEWMASQFTGAAPKILSRIYVAYGLTQYGHNGPARAVAEMKKAIQYNPEDPAARCLYADFLKDLGNEEMAEAKRILREGLELKPHDSMKKMLERMEPRDAPGE